MKVKTKIAGLMILTLIAGAGIGAFAQRVWIQQRVRGIFRMGAAGRLFPNPGDWLKPENDAQKKAIRDIFTKHGDQLAEIHKRYRKEIDASFDAMDKDLDPILTPEQKKRLKDMRPKAPRFPGGPPMRGPFPGGFPRPGFFLEELKKELNLTDDQAVQIQGIFERFREKSSPGFENGPPDGERGEFHIRIKGLDEEIEKLLSDPQKEAYRRFRKDRMKRPEGDAPPGGPGDGPGFPFP